MYIRILCFMGALLALTPGIAAAERNPGGPAGHEARQAMWDRALAGQRNLALSASFDAEGRLWRARVVDGHVLVDRSTDLGVTFSPPVKVNGDPEIIGTDGDNRPKIKVARDGTVYVSWTQLLGKPFSGHIRFSRSLDGGRSFSAPLIVNDDRGVISHRFDSLAIGAGGEVYLAWLDKREYEAAKAQGKPYAGSALYYAVSRDRGASFGADRKLADHSCECCRIALDLAPDGVPVAFWRHIYGENERDHALMRLDGKDSPRRVTHGRWQVEACPHHGPSMSIGADGVHHLTWFNNGPDERGLFYARSTDGGATFTAPYAFGNLDAQPAHPDVIGVGDEVLVVWKEFNGEVSVIRAIRSGDNGATWSAPRTVAETGDASDHPRLARSHDDRVYLSWSTLQDGHRLIPLRGER